MLNAALRSQIAQLSPQDKLEVFEVIRSAVLPQPERAFDELSLDQEQELLRRARQAKAKPGSGRDWTDVHSSLSR